MTTIVTACEICGEDFQKGDLIVGMDHVAQVPGTGGSDWVVVDTFTLDGPYFGMANLLIHSTCLIEKGRQAGSVPFNRG